MISKDYLLPPPSPLSLFFLHCSLSSTRVRFGDRASNAARYILNASIYCSDSADVFPYLAARDHVPLKTDFRPAVKVLTRRPVAGAAASSSSSAAAATASGPHYDDDEDDEDDHGGAGKKALSPEELRLKAQRDREEKQRRYEEVRQRLFGSPSAPATGATTTAAPSAAAAPTMPALAAATGSGIVAPSDSTAGGVSLRDAAVTAATVAGAGAITAAAAPTSAPASAPAVNRPGSAQAGYALVEEQTSNSFRGRGRGGRGGSGGRDAASGVSREQKHGELLLLRPAKGRAGEHGTRRQQEQQQQQLYDPGYSRKPDSIYIQRRAAAGAEPLSAAAAASTLGPLHLAELQINEIQPIRAPRGPLDSSGRGGFAARGRGGGMS